MTLEQTIRFLNNPDWDAPFFKRLSNNDTAASPGHQGGAAIPKEVQCYFPRLRASDATAGKPTVGQNIIFEIFIDGVFSNYASGRYHFQTWGNTRKPELRLTCLDTVYKSSSGGDLLIFQRKKDSLGMYRTLLLRKQTEAHGGLVDKIIGHDMYHSKKCWGNLFREKRAVMQSALDIALKDMTATVQKPFRILMDKIERRRVTHNAAARDVVFRSIVLGQYGCKCAVSEIALATDFNKEVQAAHIVGLAQGGADEPRNGFTLIRTLHWAFDNGLFCIGDDRKVHVPRKSISIAGNEWLGQFQGKKITEAADHALKAAPEAFAWHRENVLMKG